MIKILNIYAGLGGNINLLDESEYDITNVELDPKIAAVLQRRKPNQKVLVTDARQYLLAHYSEFDFVWSSPPCQANTRMIRSGRNRKATYPDLTCYEQHLFLKHNFKGLYCIENVIPYYEPLMKAQKIGRHLFWANFEIKPFVVPEFKNFINRQNLEAKKQLQKWLGIYYEENIYYGDNHCATQILRNCVHPETGLHIMNCAMNKTVYKKQAELFS